MEEMESYSQRPREHEHEAVALKEWKGAFPFRL
jgi:hypothetical protein